jgi:signal peptidase I, archaeal type
MELGKLARGVIVAFFVLLTLAMAIIVLAPLTGWHINVVLSGSMEPAIHTGGIVVISPASANDIKVGDVIAFYKGNIAVCHRVHSISDAGRLEFITKGDADRTVDPDPVTPDSIFGRVVFSLPYIGYFIYFVRTPPGFILAILAIAWVLFGAELKKMLLGEKENDKPRDHK